MMMMMRRTTTSLRTAAIVLALALMAGQASAAQLSQISYDVTGGSFTGTGMTGAITGGSLVYTPSGGSISTPVASHSGGTLKLSLTGAGGNFVLTVLNGFLANLSPNQAIFNLATSGLNWVGATNGLSVTSLNSVSATFNATKQVGFVSGSIAQSSGYFGHIFTLGNEVRTSVVPEPSTAVLLGFGMLGLGCVASGRRAAQTRRS